MSGCEQPAQRKPATLLLSRRHRRYPIRPGKEYLILREDGVLAIIDSKQD